MIRILGIDPGLANLGLADFQIHALDDVYIDLVHIVTEKSDKKRKVRASDDNLRRISELYNGVAALVHPETIAICAESQSWPRNSGACAKVGMAWGVIGSIAQMHRIPVLQSSPQEIKRKIAGAKNASKADVRKALNKLYPSIRWPSTVKGKEDTGDALAAVVACLDDQVIQMALRIVWPIK